MQRNYNEDWEGNVKLHIPESINYVKKELEPLLNEKLKSESVINHSIDTINNSAFDNQSSYGNSNDNSNSLAKENVKVRTIGARTIDSPFAKQGTSSNQEPTNDSAGSFYNTSSSDSFGFTNQDFNNWRGGYSQTLILLSTAILVMLVFIVSFFVFNYIGA